MEGSSAVAVYQTDEQARAGLDALLEAGIPEERISIVGAGEASATADIEPGEDVGARRMEHGAVFGAVVGGLVALAIPGGVVLVGGALAGAVAGGGLGGLVSVGVPDDRVSDYTEDLTDGRYLVVAHGTPEDVKVAGDVLGMTDTEELDVFV
jgi:outer membrane lipoprotein SlyB